MFKTDHSNPENMTEKNSAQFNLLYKNTVEIQNLGLYCSLSNNFICC